MRRISRVLPFALPLALPFVGAPASRAEAQSSPAPQTATMPAAKPEDVQSIDAILAALYDVISGPAGQARNWDRFRSLFIPGARLIPTSTAPGGEVRHRVLTPDEYATQAGAGLERNGFFEREISRTTESFGHITQAFSSYESKRTAQDAKPFSRGINSIQLLNDGKRWYVVTIFWDSERPDNPIPTKYLPK